MALILSNTVTKFGNPYRLRAECKKQCKIKLNGQILEKVNESEYLGLILCKYKLYKEGK